MVVELLAGERNEGESDKAVIACNDFLRLGSGRSLPKLLEKYRKSKRKSEPATDSYLTLQKWSSDYGWKSRGSIYDGQLEILRNQERRQVFESGLALDYERVGKLKSLANRLERDFSKRMWLDDVKSVGSGEFAKRIDLIRFNSALVEQYRGVLDDIAKEVGGRKQIQEHSGPNGKPIEHTVMHDLSKLPIDELKMLRELIKKITSGITNA